MIYAQFMVMVVFQIAHSLSSSDSFFVIYPSLFIYLNCMLYPLRPAGPRSPIYCVCALSTVLLKLLIIYLSWRFGLAFAEFYASLVIVILVTVPRASHQTNKHLNPGVSVCLFGSVTFFPIRFIQI